MVLDLLLVVVWLGCVVFGLGTGLLRQIFMFVAVYGGLVVASLTFVPLADGLTLVAGRERFTLLQPIAYGLALVLTIILVAALSYVTYPVTRLRRRLLDRFGGAGVAACWGLLLVAGTLITLQFLSIPVWPAAEETRRSLQVGLLESQLKPPLLENAPLLQQAIVPWMPEPVRSP